MKTMNNIYLKVIVLRSFRVDVERVLIYYLKVKNKDTKFIYIYCLFGRTPEAAFRPNPIEDLPNNILKIRDSVLIDYLKKLEG
jgi:hypothetical protein